MRRLAVAFLMLEAVLGTVWWVAIFTATHWRDAFFDPSLPEPVLLALAAADITMFVGAAAVAAVAIAQRRRWALPALWAHVGATVYATVFAVAQAVANPSCWLGGALMLPLAPIQIWFCRALRRHAVESP